MKKQQLRGQNAAVTGASSGIGRATALALAGQGVNLALIARNRERLEAVAEEARALGVRAEVFVADTTDEAAVKAAVEGALERFGRLDIFHCNAGIYLRCPARDLAMEQIRHMFETNFYGTLRCTYAVLPHFIRQGRGTLVVTVSMDGKKGVPPDAAYVATKFALNGFMQVLRQELRGTGVRVVTVFPSRTDTPQIEFVDCPAVTAKVSPQRVAEAIVRAVAGRKKEVMVPAGACRLLVWADAVSPSLGDWMIRAFRLAGWENGRPPVEEKGLNR